VQHEKRKLYESYRKMTNKLNSMLDRNKLSLDLLLEAGEYIYVCVCVYILVILQENSELSSLSLSSISTLIFAAINFDLELVPVYIKPFFRNIKIVYSS
jgi:hypothetical protein